MVLVTGLILLLIASVLGGLLLPRSRTAVVPEFAVEDLNSKEGLTKCHQDVTELYSSLGSKTSDLLATPLKEGAYSRISQDWKRFTTRWTRKWTEVDARCRFQEASDLKLGATFDRIALVHAGLPSMKLKYQTLLRHYEDEQAAELARMRKALDLSARALRSPPENAPVERPPAQQTPGSTAPEDSLQPRRASERKGETDRE